MALTFPRLLTLIAALFFTCAAAAVDAPAPKLPDLPIPKPPSVGAKGYILLDYHSGRILAEKAADEPLEPASITKMMAAYVIFKELGSGSLQLSDLVTVSEKAWRMTGSRMFIEVGKKVSVEDLLQGMIVQSGNDATVALAEHIAGSEETFAAYMNRYADELGLKSSNFVNATGLPHPKHITTARDIARIGQALIHEFPEYYKWYSQREFTFNDITQQNRNKLLWRDKSVDGIKTGHTDSAGYCLVTSAEREGMRLISVVLGTKSEEARAGASQALLNYGFRFFETHRLFEAGARLEDARVWKGAREQVALGVAQPVVVTIPRGKYEDMSADLQIDSGLMAPIAKGSRAGTLQLSLGAEPIANFPLITLDDVEEGSLWQRLSDEVLLYFE